MADETNLSSKLPIADRTREVWGRKLCWWCLSSGFPLCTFLLGFADSFCCVFTSSPFNEASQLCTILCNLFSMSVGASMLKSLREALRCLCIASSDYHGSVFLLEVLVEDFLWQTFIRHSGNMACPSLLCQFQKSMYTLHPCPFQDFCVWNPVLPLDL